MPQEIYVYPVIVMVVFQWFLTVTIFIKSLYMYKRWPLLFTVMMPVYQQNRFYSLYFIVFLLIGKKFHKKIKLNDEISNK